MATRRRSKWAKSERNRLEAPFAPFPCEMVESAAFRSLSGSAIKILFQLTATWSRSGGLAHNVNGGLIATYEQFRRFWGMDSHTAAAAMRQLKALGFVKVTEPGCAGNADERQPNQFRLTFLPAKGMPGTGSNEWKQIAPEHAKRIANEVQNMPGDGSRRVRRHHASHVNDETDETDEFKSPVGVCNGSQGKKTTVKSVSSVSNETLFPRGKISRIYISRPEGRAAHSTITTPDHEALPAAPAQPRAALMVPVGPPRCGACGAEIQSRRPDVRFCSARCRLRAYRRSRRGGK
jgi:hypothetical protein